MARRKLVDAVPLEEFFTNKAKSWAGSFSGTAYAAALEQVKAAPPVDAVEVTRCKDCEKWVDGICRHFSSYDLAEFIKVIEHQTAPESYCSNAVRREQCQEEVEP